MVCPVLLAITLKKVDLNSKEHGHAIPITMLVVATITLTADICPFLVCSLSKRFSRGSSSSPHKLTKLLAPLSSTLLVALACWIIYLILDSWAYPVIGAVIGLCYIICTVKYFRTSMGDAATTAAPAPAAARHASRGQAGRASPAVHASICISDLSLPSQRSIDSSISIENRRQGRVVDDG